MVHTIVDARKEDLIGEVVIGGGVPVMALLNAFCGAFEYGRVKLDRSDCICVFLVSLSRINLVCNRGPGKKLTLAFLGTCEYR